MKITIMENRGIWAFRKRKTCHSNVDAIVSYFKHEQFVVLVQYSHMCHSGKIQFLMIWKLQEKIA